MKIAEILILGGEIMKTLHESGVKMHDYKYIELYKDYLKMRSRGEKMTVIALMLAEKYECSERFVYKVLRRLDKDCTVGAVE